MAKIQVVDYKDLKEKAVSMRKYGKEFNEALISAYKKVETMHKYWYGKRYTDLVVVFNNMTADINTMSKLVVQEIPQSLEKIASNYSVADTGEKISVVNDTATKISNLDTHSGDVGMKFLSSEVTTLNNKTADLFEKAKKEMSNIEKVFNKVTWKSEANDAFKAQFNTLKTNITSALDNAKEVSKTLMTQATTDIESAESANTI